MKLTSAVLLALLASCHALSTSVPASKKLNPMPPRGTTDKKWKVKINVPQQNLPEVIDKNDGKASMGSEIFSLAKTIVGASCFGLPAAIASFGNAPSAVISASMLILLSGAMSGYGFSLIGRVCAYTGARSYSECWENTISPKSAWLVSAASILLCLSALLAYTMVLTATTSSLFGIAKPQALVALMVGVLLPLCRLKELKRLAPFAMMGIGAMVYTVTAMGFRYFTGAYAAGGAFQAGTGAVFGTVGAAGIFSPSAFVLIAMLSTAFSSHYNAPKFYNELRNNTIKRFSIVVASGYSLAAMMYVLVATFGFLTFGPSSATMILQDYAVQDKFMSLSRLAVAASLLTSYPLTFTGVRDSVLDITKVTNRTNKVLDITTVGLLTFLGILSLTVKDLGAVWAIGGATYGTALTVLIPPVMFIQCVRKNWRLKALRKEIPVAVTTAVLGLCMGVIGTYQAIQRFKVV